MEYHCLQLAYTTEVIWSGRGKRSDLPPIWWTLGYATPALASNSAGDR